MFSRIFIYRPIFASVISIVIMLVGAIAMFALPIARYPEISPPTIEVSAIYPGANAETIAETVATPIEREINGVEGMAYMSSTSSADGQMKLVITFDVGVDLDMANVLVQNRVSIAEPRLPREVAQQGLKVKKKSSETTLFVCLTSPDERFNEVYLSNYASLYLRDELGRVPGVGDVGIFGAGDLSMRIWFDPNRLKALGLTTSDVVGSIREQNVQVAAGQIGQPPAPAGQVFQYTVNTLGRLTSVEQFENISVRTGEGGQLTRVKDVAEVELGAQTYDVSARLNGKPTAALAVYQLPGANAISVSEGVLEKAEQLSQSFPEGLEYVVVYDSTDVINASLLVMFDQWEDRPGVALHQDAIIWQMNVRLSQIQEAGCIAFAVPSLPGVGMAGGFSLQLQDRGGGDLKSLENMANEFVFDGNAQTGLTRMYSGFRANVTQLYVG